MQALQWPVCVASVESLDTLFKHLKQLGAERHPTRCYKREEIAKEIQAIVEGGKETGKDVVAKAFLAGQYEEVISTEFYATTMDGKSTLGKMSFKNWKPLDAVVRLSAVLRFYVFLLSMLCPPFRPILLGLKASTSTESQVCQHRANMDIEGHVGLFSAACLLCFPWPMLLDTKRK